MSFNHVIRGRLNREPLSGYECINIMQYTPFLHWFGHNNQICNASAALLDEGLIQKSAGYTRSSIRRNSS